MATASSPSLVTSAANVCCRRRHRLADEVDRRACVHHRTPARSPRAATEAVAKHARDCLPSGSLRISAILWRNSFSPRYAAAAPKYHESPIQRRLHAKSTWKKGLASSVRRSAKARPYNSIWSLVHSRHCAPPRLPFTHTRSSG